MEVFYYLLMAGIVVEFQGSKPIRMQECGILLCFSIVGVGGRLPPPAPLHRPRPMSSDGTSGHLLAMTDKVKAALKVNFNLYLALLVII